LRRQVEKHALAADKAHGILGLSGSVTCV
jgi:hypothetical protein